MANPNAKNETVPVKSVSKTVLILESLANTDGIGVTEVANLTGLSKATAFRFLNTLENLGYVRQDGGDLTYSLTLKLFEIASLVRSRRTVLDEALPVLTDLSNETKETVHLATMEAGHLVYLDKIESKLSLKVSMMSEIGRSAPLYCTGVGKVLLAFLSPEEAAGIIDKTEFERFTANTITSPDLLKNELHRIRDMGYSMDNEEHELGVRCIAAPIKNREQHIVAAVSVSVPSVRLTNDKIEYYRSCVLDAAERISAIVGSGSLHN